MDTEKKEGKMELNEFLEWIKKEEKMEALQNFADNICAEQRSYCFLNSETIHVGNGVYSVNPECILEAEQPKIEEL